MSLTVAKRLVYEDYKPSNISLVFADRTIRRPYGMLENLRLQIGHVEVPTDFIVMEIDEEPRDPLILWRPFLVSAGAMIDTRRRLINLHLGDVLVMKFDITRATRKPTIDGQLFSIKGTEDEASPNEVSNNFFESLGWMNQRDYLSEEDTYMRNYALETQLEDPTRESVDVEEMLSDQGSSTAGLEDTT
ncbi:hypothetical protein V5N11_019506 [Cardamine amara subsp. amara]|uniref:Uncharacterized protein n=1 Tax=Cardamine amara subsp. amara TaxID=228776 RepID=A0ABD0ZY61_CARAN